MGGGAKKSVSVLGCVSQDRAMTETFPLVALLTHGVIPAEAEPLSTTTEVPAFAGMTS